ncbi:hypothetical protein ABVK25_011471 [Lepraria finkii]|uniref:Secreted protein n=1 Tax=Lepraria finkii TaxID=1340010 RepID=A0ABR4AP16_9LECA
MTFTSSTSLYPPTSLVAVCVQALSCYVLAAIARCKAPRVPYQVVGGSDGLSNRQQCGAGKDMALGDVQRVIGRRLGLLQSMQYQTVTSNNFWACHAVVRRR